MTKENVSTLLAESRELFSALGKTAQALKMVERALAISPDDVEALNLKAVILYEDDRDKEAEECHLLALKADPYSIEAHYGLASIANDRHDYPAALRHCQAGFKAIPKETYPEFHENQEYRQRIIAELYNEKAFALWYTGKQSKARKLLQEDGAKDCPLELETLEDQLAWLEYHPDNPDDTEDLG